MKKIKELLTSSYMCTSGNISGYDRNSKCSRNERKCSRFHIRNAEWMGYYS